MTCKDCIHYEVCFKKYCNDYTTPPYGANEPKADRDCYFFKDKSKFIKLAYKTGDIVYLVLNNKIFSDVITSIAVGNGDVIIYTPLYSFRQNEIGTFVFLTQEEAEKALKKQNE